MKLGVKMSSQAKFIKYPLKVRDENKTDIVDALGKLTATIYPTLNPGGYGFLESSITEAEALTAKMAAVDELYEAIDHPLLRELFGMIEDSGTPEANKLWEQAKLWFDVRVKQCERLEGNPMPEIQSATDSLMASIAEYVAQMDPDEAEAYWRANKEQREADAILEAHSDVPSRSI